MKVLIATDHLFFEVDNKVFDNYCFDNNFFKDYLCEFNKVTVICRSEKLKELPGDFFRSDNENTFFIGVRNYRRLSWFIFAGFLSRKKLFEEVNKADVVICRVPSELGYYAAKTARKIGKPYMVEIIGDPEEAWFNSGKGFHYKVISKISFNRLKEISRNALVGSYVSKENLSKKYPLAKDAIYDFISSIRLSDQTIQSHKYFLGEKENLILIHIGRLEPRKRVQDLIAACKLLLENGYKVDLRLVGDGKEKDKLITLANRLGLNNNVTFYGHISDRSLINQLLDESDLFVFCSASEGLPRVIIEAMARGVPVIGSSIPGVNELIRKSDSFPVGDVNKMANLIQKIYKNQSILTDMSSHSFQIASQFCESELSPKRKRLYHQLSILAGGK